MKYKFRKLSHWLLMIFHTTGHRNGRDKKVYSCPCLSLYPIGWVPTWSIYVTYSLYPAVGNSICHM